MAKGPLLPRIIRLLIRYAAVEDEAPTPDTGYEMAVLREHARLAKEMAEVLEELAVFLEGVDGLQSPRRATRKS
jgi:hypothetical protein